MVSFNGQGTPIAPPDLSTFPNRIVSADIPLTATKNSLLYTVPSDKSLLVLRVVLEGVQDMSGALRSSTLKIGLPSSFTEMLGNGVVFSGSVVSSLLNAGKLVDPMQLLVSTLSQSPVMRYAGSQKIYWDVSGVTPLTAGGVRVHLFGVLDDGF